GPLRRQWQQRGGDTRKIRPSPQCPPGGAPRAVWQPGCFCVSEAEARRGPAVSNGRRVIASGAIGVQGRALTIPSKRATSRARVSCAPVFAFLLSEVLLNRSPGQRLVGRRRPAAAASRWACFAPQWLRAMRAPLPRRETAARTPPPCARHS